MKFRWSAPAILVVTSVVVVGIVTLVAQVLTGRLMHAAHNGDYELMQKVVADMIHSSGGQALSRAEIVAATPSVREKFIARDRPKLLAETEKIFKIEHEKYEVEQMQFHVPPGTSFLRLHNPSKFGENSAQERPMLAEVHQTKLVRSGIEIAKSGPSVFGIAPIIDDAGNFQGTVEMGIEFAPKLDRMKEAFGFEAAVFFDEKILTQKATNLGGDVMSAKNRFGRFIRLHATHPELATSLVTDKEVDVSTPTSYERTVAGTAWGVQLIPLYNYANKQIGVVAIAANFGDDKKLAGRARIWELLAAFVGIVVLAGMIFIVIRGTLVAPLAALNERMSVLASGGEAPAADPNESYCEELQTLASNYEKLRTAKNT